MDTNRPIIICGSGNSIPFYNEPHLIGHDGIHDGIHDWLKEIVKCNYSIGLNYWYKFGCETTFNCSGDWQFYIDNYKELKDVPMVVACADIQLKNKERSIIHPNTTLVKHSGIFFGKEGIEKGFYTRQLTGMFSISIAIALGFKEIYLLGYDCKEIDGKTHFYQEVADLEKHTKVYLRGQLKDKRFKFRGVGKHDKTGNYKTSTYNHPEHLNKKWYKPFADHKGVNIYNVSPESAIDIFSKITYQEFLDKIIVHSSFNQNTAREEIKAYIKSKIS